MTDANDQVLDHDYDGIREYDNPLPRWWLYMFYLTIAFSLLYMPYYHFMGGKLPMDEYKADMKAFYEAHPPLVLPSREELETLAKNPKARQEGKKVFDLYCVACHLADGGGLVGPNLTDDYSIHGQALDRMVAVVANGVPEKGMIAWKNQLKAEELFAVTVYVHSLRGTTPAQPKAPQGQVISE